RWPRDWSSDVCSSDLEQRQRPREKPSGKLGNGRGHHHYDSAQDHSLGPVKGVLLDVPPQNRGNHPQQQEAREDGELRRQGAELVRMLLVHDISMLRCWGCEGYQRDTLVP